VWTDRGSPLLFHSQDLVEQVSALLGPSWQVELAMRYGEPTVADALERFRSAGIDRVVVLPLFPQYASSSTGSALEAVFRQAGEKWNVPNLSVIEPFYADAGFIGSFAAVGRPALEGFGADHVLFSFHGLPERHVRKSDESGRHCFASPDCCDRLVPANRNCYRAQCVATARLIAAELDLGESDYTVCFQSRLGRTPWISPYTDKVLDELARAGKKRLAVFCPAFVADCLETLEEIGIRAREQFQASGGDELILVPSLNSEEPWARAVVALVNAHAMRLAAG
jgi:ferrochelatase